MRVASFDVIRLLDGRYEAPLDVLTHLGGEDAIHALRRSWHGPTFVVDVNCFALRTPEAVILVDAGTGPSWGETLGHAPEALRQAGLAPEQVSAVLLTHLHGDHALGLLDGDAAAYPGAEILVPAAELARFTDAVARDAASEDQREVFRIAERIVHAYPGRTRAIPPGHVMPGIEAVPLPGHTRAHTGYLIEDGPASLLLVGDMLQAVTTPVDPDAGLVFDEDPAQAAQTRRDWLARLAETGWRLSGGHLPGVFRVGRLAPGGRSGQQLFDLIPAG